MDRPFLRRPLRQAIQYPPAQFQAPVDPGRNYQWQLDPASTPEFPKGENLTSVMAQASLIYFWKK